MILITKSNACYMILVQLMKWFALINMPELIRNLKIRNFKKNKLSFE